MTNEAKHINAMPTKAFFVDMLVRDIPTERAILDLVDNCIDGAKRLRPGNDPDFDGLWVKIHIDGDRFEITDNCGGFDTDTAINYAFRFGRPADAKSTDYSIGQFGVGMKRALFKFGRYFEVHSTTEAEKWSVEVDVSEWEDDGTWQFDFAELIEDGDFPPEERGTRIVVDKLRPEIANRFSSDYFRRGLAETIRAHQRQFLSAGLAIEFNGQHLTQTDLRVFSGGSYSPVVEEVTFDAATDTPVLVRIIAGIADSKPSNAGWYVVCNGRVILSADRSEATGWNSVADQKDGIPKFHNQYARFRGIVFFDCSSSQKLPWNTTKTGLDETSAIWQSVFPKMLDHTRTIIKFLNRLDEEVEEYGKNSPTLSALAKEASALDVEKIRGSKSFAFNKNPKAPGPKMTKIQYSREVDKIRVLMDALGVGSAKAVGETTFDMILAEQGEEE
ncbi:ATP-binding protein [Qipengyuania aurantiaca]|uniref:ATP-binding protein n=1 Tax=Qipengyuania aurantiaca TaxID=2867233 RepID=A0ABX8ZLK0_9SPHN|nr:ATP-binding protein [Qipengyuania aurantiaca]QZD89895.1 ATP-binding protein [Qipengyuania aurantiaca]